MFVVDFKTLLFHIGMYSSAPTTTAQSTKPESADHGMTLMIVIHFEWRIDVLEKARLNIVNISISFIGHSSTTTFTTTQSTISEPINDGMTFIKLKY